MTAITIVFKIEAVDVPGLREPGLSIHIVSLDHSPEQLTELANAGCVEARAAKCLLASAAVLFGGADANIDRFADRGEPH